MALLSQRAALLVALLLGACAWRTPAPDTPQPIPAADCAAASARNPARLAPGLGGTGAQALADPGGIGGTGQTAQEGTGLGGTGIVGVVTGFASVCVNGVEVEVQPSTPVRRNGASADLRDLEVGHVVLVQAEGTGATVRALRIDLVDALVGPIASVQPALREIAVMGQRVSVLADADFRGLKAGDWIRVSGHRAPDGVRGSRLQVVPPPADRLAQVLGPLETDGGGGWRIGTTPVDWSASTPPPAVGTEIMARGPWDGARMRVTDAAMAPTRGAVGSQQQVRLQGYLHQLDGNRLSLGYAAVQLGDGVRVLGGRPSDLRVGLPVQVNGRWIDGQRVMADSVYLGREGRRGARSGGESTDDGGRRGRNRGGDDSGDAGSDDSGGDDSGSDSSGSGSDSSGSGSSGSGSSSGSSGGQGRGRGRSGGD